MTTGDPDTSGLVWNDATGWQLTPKYCTWPRCDCSGLCATRVKIEPPPILDVRAWGAPNRLYGATINHEGDAV